MTEYLVKRTGKLLFPHLARDQRKHRLSIIMLVLLTSVFGDGTLVICMMHGWH
jgi:hypothetical protein